MSKKVIIVCFTFPPTSGIGGRRWAKFAKYLDRLGHDVQVVSALQPLQKQNSPWTNDVVGLRNKPLFIKSGYLDHLGTNPISIKEKIRYRAALKKAKKKAPGNFYDKSAFWKPYINNQIELLIKKGYNNVIVSCAPFRSALFLLELKSSFPEVNFICDFRDPWVDNKTAYGFDSLEIERQQFERNAEKLVVEGYNAVVSVSESMSEDFKKKYPNQKNLLTIQNGFDWEDINVSAQTHQNSNKLRLILCGTLYNKAMHVFEELVDVLRELKISGNNIFSSFQLDFYGTVPSGFHELTSDLENVNYHGFIGLEDVYNEISKSQICMLFMTDDLNYSFSTKFYEYVAMKKTIAVFTKEGITGRYIEQNGLGYMLEQGNIKNKFLQMVHDYEQNTLRATTTFDVSKHSCDNLVKKVDEILI